MEIGCFFSLEDVSKKRKIFDKELCKKYNSNCIYSTRYWCVILPFKRSE